MILITGATGNVGGAVIRELATAGAPVRGLTRSAGRAEFPDGVEVAEGDLCEPASLGAAFQDVDAMFLFYSGNETAVLKAAEEAGVRRVVLLSTIATQSRPETGIGHDHLQAEHAVANSELDWIFLRPGGFASNTLGWAPMVRNGTVYAPFADVAMPLIHPGDIAAVAVRALTERGHNFHVYPLSGPTRVNPAQQVAAIGAAIGRSLRYVEISRDEARTQLTQHMPAEIAEATLDFVGSPTAEELVVQPTVEQVTKRPARTYAEWVLDNVAVFR